LCWPTVLVLHYLTYGYTVVRTVYVCCRRAFTDATGSLLICRTRPLRLAGWVCYRLRCYARCPFTGCIAFVRYAHLLPTAHHHTHTAAPFYLTATPCSAVYGCTRTVLPALRRLPRYIRILVCPCVPLRLDYVAFALFSPPHCYTHFTLAPLHTCTRYPIYNIPRFALYGCGYRTFTRLTFTHGCRCWITGRAPPLPLVTGCYRFTPPHHRCLVPV